jgi:hypothetical protein
MLDPESCSIAVGGNPVLLIAGKPGNRLHLNGSHEKYDMATAMGMF